MIFHEKCNSQSKRVKEERERRGKEEVINVIYKTTQLSIVPDVCVKIREGVVGVFNVRSSLFFSNSKLRLSQMSILQTLFEYLFCAKVFCSTFIYLQFCFVIFWQKKLLVKCWGNSLQISCYGKSREQYFSVSSSRIFRPPLLIVFCQISDALFPIINSIFVENKKRSLLTKIDNLNLSL